MSPLSDLKGDQSTGWQLVKLLWQANAIPGGGGRIRGLLRRMNYVIRLLPGLQHIRTFLQANGNQYLRDELQYSLTPLKSISRPYVHADWSVPERIQALTNHYQILTQENYLKLKFLPNQYWDCASINFANDVLTVKIDKADWMRPEGELTLSAFWGIHRAYAVAFSLQTTTSGRVLQIGALQGWQNEKAKDLYADLTTSMHGLRPRDLMVNLAQMVAMTLGCNEVWGISDASHHTNIRGNADKKHSAYDEIWRENGGLLNNEGFFVLPVVLRKREFADIPSKKRAQYRRRYELLDELQDKIAISFENNLTNFKTH